MSVSRVLLVDVFSGRDSQCGSEFKTTITSSTFDLYANTSHVLAQSLAFVLSALTPCVTLFLLSELVLLWVFGTLLHLILNGSSLFWHWHFHDTEKCNPVEFSLRDCGFSLWFHTLCWKVFLNLQNNLGWAIEKCARTTMFWISSYLVKYFTSCKKSDFYL